MWVDLNEKKHHHDIQSLAKVPNFGVLKKLVEEMTKAAPGKSAA